MRFETGKIVLGDDLEGAFIDEFFIDPELLTEIVQIPRAANPLMFDRQNLQATITFKVNRVHASRTVAKTYIARHLIDVPGKKLVKWSDRDDRGAFTIFMPGALVLPPRGTCMGKSTDHWYRIIAGRMTTQNPVT